MIRVARALLKIFKVHTRRHPIAMGLFLLSLFLFAGVEVWFHFAPAPAQDWLAQNMQQINAENPNDYTFAVFGDNKNSHATFPKLLGKLSRDKEILFAMDLGDLVFDGEIEKYRYFFSQIRKNLNIPFLTAIGNHELGEKGRGLYYDLFGPSYYSFKVGESYFIILDDANEKRIDQWQRLWLENELQEAAKYSHRFVFMHVPLFDPRGSRHHHCLPGPVGQSLLDLFVKYKASRIIAAHIHGYYQGEWQGIPFTITGGAGGELVGKDPQHDFFHYLKVHVHGDRASIAVVPVATPDYEWLDRIASMAWIYVYATFRFHGIEIAIFLLMAFFLSAVAKAEGSGKQEDDPGTAGQGQK